MRLSNLIEKIEYKVLLGSLDTEVSSLVYDSRKVEDGSVFICIKGTTVDGHQYIDDVIAKGAKAIVVEESFDADISKYDGVTFISAKDNRVSLAYMSAAFFGYPAKSLKTIGVTGTKGKTTTTYVVKSILEGAGIKCGLIGTIETIVGDKRTPNSNTTPESYLVQKYFKEMVDAGLEAVVMEVSSQAMLMNRVAGIEFDLGVFTNLEPDHIGENEHKDFADYMYCKSLLFRQCKVGVFNNDSEHIEGILKGHNCEVITYGLNEGADYQAVNTRLVTLKGALGVGYEVKGRRNLNVEVNQPGIFSIYNSLCAIAICDQFGIKDDILREALTHITVKGRIEMIHVSDDFTLMIDYAHNAMALESLLTTLKAYNPGRLVTLFGCGGNRAKSRRYEMGEVSSRLSDLTIVTSDNPRNEEPMDIIADILIGVKKCDGEYVTIPDRKEAIKYAIENGKPGDIIVLAGKGHEDYQEIKGVKHHMDERELIAEILEELA